jgi:hypothetical protein
MDGQLPHSKNALQTLTTVTKCSALFSLISLIYMEVLLKACDVIMSMCLSSSNDFLINWLCDLKFPAISCKLQLGEKVDTCIVK